MLKNLNKILNIVIGSCIGVFLAASIYRYIHFINNPLVYEYSSAPWYTGIIIHGVINGLIILVLLIIKLVIKIISKNNR